MPTSFPPPRHIAGLVLAAGASSRMGSPKALLDVRGRPAVERVVETLDGGGASPVTLVVGRHAAEIRAGANLEGVAVVDHPGWAAGRTSSLQAGLAALPDTAAGALLTLVDMPLVRPETVRALIERFDPEGTDEFVVPLHDGRRGHPILLARCLFERIGALGPAESLRDLLRGCRRGVVVVDDPGILQDFDTPEDAAAL